MNRIEEKTDFQKEKRLRNSEQFVEVLRARSPFAVKHASELLEIKALLKPSSETLKFGFTVGKKFAPLSVDRNLIRRILREAVRHKSSDFSKQALRKDTGLAICLRLSKSILETKKTTSKSEFKKTLRKEVDNLLDKLLRTLSKKTIDA